MPLYHQAETHWGSRGRRRRRRRSRDRKREWRRGDDWLRNEGCKTKWKHKSTTPVNRFKVCCLYLPDWDTQIVKWIISTPFKFRLFECETARVCCCSFEMSSSHNFAWYSIISTCMGFFCYRSRSFLPSRPIDVFIACVRSFLASPQSAYLHYSFFPLHCNLKDLNVCDEWIYALHTNVERRRKQTHSFSTEFSVKDIHQTVQWQMYKTSACMAFDPFGMECWDFLKRIHSAAAAAAAIVDCDVMA